MMGRRQRRPKRSIISSSESGRRPWRWARGFRKIRLAARVVVTRSGPVRRVLAAAGLFALSIMPVRADEPSATAPAYRGTPGVDGGRCCATLGEVRDNIDRIDREI